MRFFQFENHHKWLSLLFPIHLNTYVVGLRPFEIFFSYSAGIDFSRQNLTSEVDLRAVRIKLVVDP